MQISQVLKQLLENVRNDFQRGFQNADTQPGCSILEVADATLATVSNEVGRRVGVALEALRGK
jgi:hypothetical protein